VTLMEWFKRVARVAVGRPERPLELTPVSEIELPSIDPQPKGTRPASGEERNMLEKRKQEQEVQLERLRILARIKTGRHDT
jgi:hypothetical protein